MNLRLLALVWVWLPCAAVGMRAESSPGAPSGLEFTFTLEGVASTLELPGRMAGRRVVAPFIRSAPLDADLVVDRRETQLRLRLATSDPAAPGLATLRIARLEGERPYHLVIAWDYGTCRLRLWLDGVDQGDLMDFAKARWTGPQSQLDRGVELGAEIDGAKVVTRDFRWLEAWPENPRPGAQQGRAPLRGEARTLYTEPLDLSGLEIEVLHHEEFERPPVVVPEEEFVRDDRWVLAPPENAWIAEGPARVEVRDGRLHFSTTAPAPGLGEEGNVVLWLNRAFPGDLLVEYDFFPDDPERGLHILFFSAGNDAEASPFASGSPMRAGVFKRYFNAPFASYHASLFATDDTTPRLQANLRKNPGLALVACGDDRIAGRGPGPHRVRLLKIGGKIRVEVNGLLSLAFDDDGRAYGPVLGGGFLGWRIMRHSGGAAIDNLRVSQIVRRAPSRTMPPPSP